MDHPQGFQRRPLDDAVWSAARVRELCRALRTAGAADAHLLERFLADIWTPADITEMANRWAAAVEVQREARLPRHLRRSQLAIATDLDVSPNLVNRASQIVRGPNGTGGFVDVFDQLTRASESGCSQGG